MNIKKEMKKVSKKVERNAKGTVKDIKHWAKTVERKTKKMIGKKTRNDGVIDVKFEVVPYEQ